MKYQITIKDLESGEVVLCEKCDAIIGGLAHGDTESAGQVAARSFSITHSTIAVSLGAISATKEAVQKLENDVKNDFFSSLFDNVLKEIKNEND